MRQAINEGRRRVGALIEAGKGLLRGVRARSPWLAHLYRAYDRYQDRRGDRLAAALTSYGFLSFFPLLALAYSLLGYLVGVSDEARDYFVDAVNSLLPGLSEQVPVEQIAKSKTAVGVLGLAALLFTGLGWVQVLRESLREMWGNEPAGEGNFVVKKLWDGAVLLFLGAALVLGMAVTTIAGSTTHTVLDWLGLDRVPGAGFALRLLSLALAIGVNTLIFLFLFSRLSGTHAPWRRIIRGGLFGALGFEVLKQTATLLLGHTTRNPVYASFAVLVGLMVWINIASRFMLFVGAWTATRRVVLRADAEAEDEEREAEARRAEEAEAREAEAPEGDGPEPPGASRAGTQRPGQPPGRSEPLKAH